MLYLCASSRIGGAERSLLEYLATPPREQVLVCAPEGESVAALQRLGIRTEVVEMPRLRRTWGLIGRLPQIVHTLVAIWHIGRREGVALIHSNRTYAHLYGAIAAQLLGIPSVWHVRDLIPLGLLGKVLFRLSDRIIAVSEAAKRYVLSYGRVEGKVTRIYNGLDIDRWDRVPSRAPSFSWEAVEIKETPFRILCVASLAPWKRHEILLEAFAQVVGRCGNHLQLWLVGSDLFGDHPDYEAGLKRQAATRGVTRYVRFLGQRGDVPELLKRCHLLVLPSVKEPFGRVLLEAMASRKPVIATRGGGPAEIVEDGRTGFLIPPNDADALGERMEYLFRHPSIGQRMGEDGRIRVERSFRLEDTVHQIQRLHADLIRDRLQCT